jgi:hypothetical protein
MKQVLISMMFIGIFSSCIVTKHGCPHNLNNYNHIHKQKHKF